MAKSIKELEEETQARFKSLEDSLIEIVGLIKKKDEPAAAPKEPAQGQPDRISQEVVHPDWIKDAQEKMGDKLDHCEIDYPKNGVPRYTVVIKNEFSNAGKDYLAFYKVDRRTVPVTNGLETIKLFNSLVQQNLRTVPIK